MTNMLLGWTGWSPVVQEVVAVLGYWLVIGGLMFGNGYFWGSAVTMRRMKNMLSNVLRAMVESSEEDNGWSIARADGASLNLTPAMIVAAHDLDHKTFTRLAQKENPEFPNAVGLPVMHMIRAGHPSFTEGEKLWSVSWLRHHGGRQHKGGVYSMPTSDDDDDEVKPVIN